MKDEMAKPGRGFDDSHAPITKGDLSRLWQTIESRFDRIDDRLTDVESRFGRVDARLAALESRFDQVDERLTVVESRFDRVDERLTAVESRFDLVDERLSAVQARFDLVDERLSAVESRLAKTATQQSVENLAEQFAIFRGEVQAAVEENRNHFDVAVEHIRAELEGANRDEVSALQDGMKDLRVRVAALENEGPPLR